MTGGNLSGRNDVVTTVNQYCPGNAVHFWQSSSFFANPVSIGALHQMNWIDKKQTGLPKTNSIAILQSKLPQGGGLLIIKNWQAHIKYQGLDCKTMQVQREGFK